MKNLTAQQASDLGKTFLELEQLVADFRYSNWDKLSKLQNQKLGSLQWSILNSAEDIFALSTIIVMDDVQRDLTKIKDITKEINKTLKMLKDIQKGIDIAAAVVTLAAAIISKNPPGIVDSINELSKAVTNGQ